MMMMPFYYINFVSETYCFLAPDYVYILLNLLILNLGITILFCFDSHVERALISISPHSYSENFTGNDHKNELIKTLIKAIIDSLIIFYGFYKGMGTNTLINEVGMTIDNNSQWISYVSCCNLVIFCKLLFIELKCWNIANIVITMVTAGGVFTIAYIRTDTFDFTIETLSFLTLLVYYLGVVMFTLICELAYNSYYFHFAYSNTLKTHRLNNYCQKIPFFLFLQKLFLT